MIAAIIGALATLMVVSSIVMTFRAAQTARTPQGAVGWVVFLLAAPFIAVPLYLVLGHHRFRGYLVARQESADVIHEVEAFSQRFAPAPDASGLSRTPFERLAGFSATRGNAGKLLIDGKASFDAIFAAIDRAQDYVLVQFYIIRDDGLGQRLAEHLIKAAERGVSVRVMVDAVGSYGLPDSYRDRLRAAGIAFPDRRAGKGPRFRFQINYRNHRKTVIVDGRTGFTGGLNVGDEYLGLDPDFGNWRDTHLRLQGPMVQQLQLIFAEDWHWATGEDMTTVLSWEPHLSPDDATGLIVATGPADPVESGSMMFFSAIAQAQTRVWIASPYFVPDLDISTALAHAAMRGVDVRLLVPDQIDHTMPWLAAFAYFDRVRDAGVKIYRYRDGFMHQKVLVADDTLAMIGTTNLDNRSFLLNFEQMALFFDADMAADTAAMLERDFDRSVLLDRSLSQQKLKIRLGAPLARLFSPLL